MTLEINKLLLLHLVGSSILLYVQAVVWRCNSVCKHLLVSVDASSERLSLYTLTV